MSCPKKHNGSAVIVVVFVIVAIIVGIVLISLIGTPRFLYPLLSKLPQGTSSANISASAKAKGLDVQVKGIEGNATLSAIPQDKWPEGVVGGLFELDTADKQFSNIVTVDFIFEKYPGPGFALGYYNPDTKSWTYIPTIQRGLKYYQGYLPHASQVGGYTPPPADAASQGKFGDISAQLKKMQDDQAQGKEDPADWDKISAMLKDLADQAISDCSKNASPENIRQFYYIWGLIQLMGNDSLNTQMEEAQQNCDPQKEDVYSTYIIDQTNDISNSQDFNGQVKVDSQSHIISDGITMPSVSAVFSPQKWGWQREWDLRQDFATDSSSNFSLHNQGSWITPFGGSGTITDRTVSLFSLVNVQEGQDFPVQIVRTGELNGSFNGPGKSIFVNSASGDSKYMGQAPTSASINMGQGASVEVHGKLVKDLGEQGAIIEIGDRLSGAQQKQIQQIDQMLAGTQFAGAASKATSGPAVQLRIRKQGSPTPSPASK